MNELWKLCGVHVGRQLGELADITLRASESTAAPLDPAAPRHERMMRAALALQRRAEREIGLGTTNVTPLLTYVVSDEIQLARFVGVPDPIEAAKQIVARGCKRWVLSFDARARGTEDHARALLCVMMGEGSSTSEFTIDYTPEDPSSFDVRSFAGQPPPPACASIFRDALHATVAAVPARLEAVRDASDDALERWSRRAARSAAEPRHAPSAVSASRQPELLASLRQGVWASALFVAAGKALDDKEAGALLDLVAGRGVGDTTGVLRHLFPDTSRAELERELRQAMHTPPVNALAMAVFAATKLDDRGRRAFAETLRVVCKSVASTSKPGLFGRLFGAQHSARARAAIAEIERIIASLLAARAALDGPQVVARDVSRDDANVDDDTDDARWTELVDHGLTRLRIRASRDGLIWVDRAIPLRGDDLVYVGTHRHDRNAVPRFVHVRTGVIFHLIPGGQTTIGASEQAQALIERRGYEGDTREARVCRVEPFLLAEFPCTLAQWRAGDGDQDVAEGPDDAPVEAVARWRAQRWCAEHGMRLPTEVEWEHACRAGTSTLFSWGDDEVASYCWTGSADDEDVYHTVAEHDGARNPYGLVDMLGGTSEWVEDDEHEPDEASASGPLYDMPPCNALLRGGGRMHGWQLNHSACRIIAADVGDVGIGFRPAIDIPDGFAFKAP